MTHEEIEKALNVEAKRLRSTFGLDSVLVIATYTVEVEEDADALSMRASGSAGNFHAVKQSVRDYADEFDAPLEECDKESE